MSASDLPETSGTAACAACGAAASAQVLARHAQQGRETTIVLSLPGMHCAGCIATVERALASHPGVRAARVNLTQKRASVSAAPDVTPSALIETLAGAGYEAHEMDGDTARLGAADRAGRELLMRLGVAGFAAMNVMLLSVSVWAGAEGATRDLFHWISAAITLPAALFAGQPFFRNALAALRAGG